MMRSALDRALRETPDYERLESLLKKGGGPLAVLNLQNVHKAHLLCALSESMPVLAVAASEAQAAALRDLASAFGAPARLFLPRDIPLVHVMEASWERSSARIAALSSLLRGGEGPVITCVSALMQKLCPPDVFAEGLFTLSAGDECDPRELVKRLTACGYERTGLVSGPGQCALRGDILDVFCPDSPVPYRVEFFGDEIDQIRSFDPETQRSLEQLRSCVICPALETPQPEGVIRRGLGSIAGKEGFDGLRQSWESGQASPAADALLPVLYAKTATILDYLPAGAAVIVDEPHRVEESAENAFLLHREHVEAMLERGEGLPAQGELLIDPAGVRPLLVTERTLSLYALSRPHTGYAPRELVRIDARPAPAYMSDMPELARDIRYHTDAGSAVLLFAGDRAGQLENALAEQGLSLPVYGSADALPERGKAAIFRERLPQGFHYPEGKVLALAEAEIFGEARIRRAPERKKSRLRFSELAAGDYIVHEVHGIGRFLGVIPLTVDGKTKDYLNIEYKGGDRLFIPTDQLDRIQKYIGGNEDVAPPVSKLGGSDWAGRVSRVRASAKKLAFDLTRLYAERAARGGFAFPPDGEWQKKFEEGFPFTETPDQLRAVEEIKRDMEAPRPMDRLLCGDVGYGKTEVALRAVFKAVQSGKQAAILVPTTILAEQHYATASNRFSSFPVRTACLSRFRTAAEKALIKKGIADGTIDLVIGTHALLAKDVRFRDLGLLVVDEEHRFGVNHKEQIKQFRKTVDVLTLSATPIPRTLNMSMTGIRDISLIETPPESRFPVQTFVTEYSDGLITETIRRELSRGGQVYLVSNRVAGMEGYAERVRGLVPEARLLTAHGQMAENVLERNMLSFYNGEADVLLCSTIIESGLDVPNANTLIVTDADRMGLAQLHQLRGRVGRSTRPGYAYFTVQRNMALSEKAAKRLSAIREFTRFGAGFQVAMRDLEIRGAGSLLGAEQHGHIADIGYEYYCKLMNAAVREAKGEAPEFAPDTSIDLALDAHIPPSYVTSEVQRLYAYRRIADIRTNEDVMDVREELTDRYGDIPAPVENLFLSALIKSLAGQAMLSSVTVRDGEAKLLYDPHADIDGARLLGVLSGYAGTKLLGTQPPAILLRLPGRDARGVAETAAGLLAGLSGCAGVREE